MEEQEWGMNVDEFVRRFHPDSTNGQGLLWLRNLYFVYLLDLRALAKASPLLENIQYYTGDTEEDQDVRDSIQDILKIIK